jgi:hypothetical protein
MSVNDVAETMRRYYQLRSDEVLAELLQARKDRASPDRLMLLTQAYDRLWRAASYVRRDDA